MSIHPHYADAILDGAKDVEFRKRGLAPDIDIVVIYATAPIQRVIGEFKIKTITSSTPSALWKAYGRCGGIRRPDFDEYFRDSSAGFAIEVASRRRYGHPVELTDITEGMTPPQSYRYISAQHYSKLLADADRCR